MSTSKKEVFLRSKKTLECKLAKAVEKNKKLVEELSELRAERRKLRKDTKRITASRDKWKDEAVKYRRSYKALTSKVLLNNSGEIEQEKPKRHHYTRWLITLVVVLRIYCNCSYGSIEKALLILRSDYGLGLNENLANPCKNTMQNWVSKIGFYYLQQTDNEFFKQELCLIIDESVRVGTEKLLMVLACPLNKIRNDDLRKEDVRVVGVRGSNTWKGNEIAEFVSQIMSEKGLKVGYILSDEGNNLVKASKLLDLPHLPDISHLIATCLKKTFKDKEEFKLFSTAVNKCQAKLAMGEYCFLRPPKQRAKARFLNQERVVNWAITIFEKWDEIELVAQQKLALIQPHKAMIDTLKYCIDFGKSISKTLKNNGLSSGLIKKLILKINKEIHTKNEQIMESTFLNYIKLYLEQYQKFINREAFKGKVIHTCSDIIERLFGIYKAKVSDNYFVTTTTIGLELPLMCLSRKRLSQMVQPALEAITMTNLRDWLGKQRADNQSTKRAKFLKK